MAARIKFVFRNCRVHLVPRLCVETKKSICGRNPLGSSRLAAVTPTNPVGRLVGLPAGNSRAAFSAGAALVFAAARARSEMVAQLPLGQTECWRRHQQAGDESAAGQLLAVSAVALEHHDRFSRAFVTNRPARAAAGKGNFHANHAPQECLFHGRFHSWSGISASTSFANSVSDSCQPR